MFKMEFKNVQLAFDVERLDFCNLHDNTVTIFQLIFASMNLLFYSVPTVIYNNSFLL